MITRIKICCLILSILSLATVLKAEPTDSPAQPTLEDNAYYDHQEILRIMTYNIRLNNSGDGLNAWPYRKDAVAGLIRFHRPDIIGLQEPSRSMAGDLQRKLPEYRWCSPVTKENGEEFWPSNPIFYRVSRVKLLDYAYFWLDNTSEAEIVSRGKAINYTTVWALFEDLKTHNKFYVFNVHFDWRQKIAQQENAHVLLAKVNEIAGDTPTFVIGDFNTRENSATYQYLTRGSAEEGVAALTDSKFISEYGHYGPEKSFGGFTTAGYRGNKIDYIFVKNKIYIVQHGILSDTYGDNKWPSDHLPIKVEALIGFD